MKGTVLHQNFWTYPVAQHLQVAVGFGIGFLLVLDLLAVLPEDPRVIFLARYGAEERGAFADVRLKRVTSCYY